eukprot:4372170-Amphidinium_carterae.1
MDVWGEAGTRDMRGNQQKQLVMDERWCANTAQTFVRVAISTPSRGSRNRIQHAVSLVFRPSNFDVAARPLLIKLGVGHSNYASLGLGPQRQEQSPMVSSLRLLCLVRTCVDVIGRWCANRGRSMISKISSNKVCAVPSRSYKKIWSK